jgi:hypothetical protein
MCERERMFFGRGMEKSQEEDLKETKESMSSRKPMIIPYIAMDVTNGRIQLSGPSADKSVGILIERGESYCGIILSHAEAENLARRMLMILGGIGSARHGGE